MKTIETIKSELETIFNCRITVRRITSGSLAGFARFQPFKKETFNFDKIQEYASQFESEHFASPCSLQVFFGLTFDESGKLILKKH